MALICANLRSFNSSANYVHENLKMEFVKYETASRKSSKKKRRKLCLIIIFVVLGILCLCCFFAGIALIAEARRNRNTDESEPSKQSDCDYSQEAKRAGLDDLFQKVQNKYFELYPNKITGKPNVSPEEVKKRYRSYDPTPASIKLIAHEAAKIADEIEKMPISMDKLTLREKRGVAQLLHWAKHAFPFMVPYGYDYYVGDWMMGPDIFCWFPICMVPSEVGAAFKHFKPSTVSDVELLRDRFKELENTFNQFVENMRLGVDAGMVRTIEECKAGLDGLKGSYKDVALKGPSGIKSLKI